MPVYRKGHYYHDTDDFGPKILQHDAGLTAHIAAIAEEAGKIAVATAPEDTGEFKDSFIVGTAVEDHEGLRVIGFLGSVDPEAVYKEFAQPSGRRTMNDAMRKAAGA